LHFYRNIPEKNLLQFDFLGAWSEQRFTLNVVERVIPVNESPVIRSVPIEQIRLENIYRYKINAFDPNGDKLSFRLDSAPVGASISSDGVLTWNPTQTGKYDFSIIVSDGTNDVSQSFTLMVKYKRSWDTFSGEFCHLVSHKRLYLTIESLPNNIPELDFPDNGTYPPIISPDGNYFISHCLSSPISARICSLRWS
jgi:hypothetical protein